MPSRRLWKTIAASGVPGTVMLKWLPPRWHIKDTVMALTLSESAVQQVRKSIAKRGKGLGIRIGVKTSGCSGLSYIMEFVDAPNPEDMVFPHDDVSLFVDPKSLIYLDGTELDFTREGLNEGFRFNNPNVKDSCGCGESFTT
jgi:iron-sulfur cluster assembly protein